MEAMAADGYRERIRKQIGHLQTQKIPRRFLPVILSGIEGNPHFERFRDSYLVVQLYNSG